MYLLTPQIDDLDLKSYDLSDDARSALCKTILVLEDDGDFAGTLKQVLEEQGYKITVAESGAEGLRMVLARDYDAIVCDMVMPYYPGDMFYVAVKMTKPRLCERFIFITGHKSDPKIADFIEQTGQRVLWKPFKLEELFGMLEEVTGRKR